MKIGMNLLLYTTQPDEAIFPVCEKLQRMGFDGLEWPIFGTDATTAAKIRKFNEKQGLGATTVFVFGTDANPINPDAGKRAEAMTALKEKIEITAALGGTHLVGPIVQQLGAFSGSPPTADEWKRCVEFFQQVADHAKKNNVTLILEYLNRFEIYILNTAADAARMCKEINHPSVKTMVDSFHANIEEKNLRDAVLAAKDYLGHIHISENDRGVPGSSKCIQWDDMFSGIKDAGYDGYLMIESFGQALPDLAAAAKIWRPMFKHSDDVGTQGIAFIKSMMAKHQLK